MKHINCIKRYILISGILIPGIAFGVTPNEIEIENALALPVNDNLKFSADIVLDDLRVGANRQVYITPILEDGNGNSATLPSTLVNGRTMQILWERGAVKVPANYENGVQTTVRRNNGKPQQINYNAALPMEKWMWSPSASVRWVVDSCGCGHFNGSVIKKQELLSLNPAEKMRASYLVPAIAPLPVTIHEGKAQVQYEVNRSDLHSAPYVCANGQVIDNRFELKIIDDSISNALSNKNMEISKIKICGYASPDGSYVGNEQLSTERSRSLAEYVASRYNLTDDKAEYSAVAENWKGFRDIVEIDTRLSNEQRNALLKLIDRPAYGPSDYDAKEKELRTSPEFRSLYSSIILPEWFPLLRTTRFEIETRLKPLDDAQLAEVITTDPDKMSLNQMFRVSKLYPEGSEEFNDVIQIMLKYYPEDEAANLNAASAALKMGNLDEAEVYLKKAGDSKEAWNARGILATWRGDMDAARDCFRKAGALSEAAKNLEMLGN
ncbi:tetratricopeptide repeat protein [Lepagella muris]|jgi:tetratricopeptide (TPR) repeat protein|uniref:Uncharacterized protein n=1 Tax=Lepagella muris TaxID=3032870 RepID=A0AC61RJW1_9BACT|nr:hypothetical protein [Lepagella muris]ROT07733.1 hypothetical protein EEL33_06760 [Muribaculaceae bacterium Isolate-037 (Harlan)]TGY78821.1 hypothetical protein E5331_08430 [Lepagella muris]THG52261.1 hypothetical protein E5984_07705 [Bacteroidales bacterium]TKC60495.1 hypothetical protein E5359_007955 [Bacteroidales bacterium]